MQLTSFECVSPRFLLQLSHPMSIANQIPKLASAPRQWAAFTNSSAITLSPLLIRCPMNFSRISLPASPRIFLVRLLLHIQMLIPILPIPLYLLSTPMIQPISLVIKNDLRAIPMSTYQYAAQRLNPNTRVWAAPTPIKDSLDL